MPDNKKPAPDTSQHISYELPTWDENGKVCWNLQLQHKSKDAHAKLLKPPTKVIPVIFLPGVMGTNLMANKNNRKEVIWRGDDDIDVYLEWAPKKGKQRRKLLNPETTQTDNRGEISENTYSTFSDDGCLFPSRRDRHWGEVLYFSYGQFLNVFQGALMDDWQKSMTYAAKQSNNRDGVLRHLVNKSLSQEKYATITNESVMTEDELNHFQHFLFPVHVFGYNWLQDNKKSAEELVNYIDEVIDTYKHRHGHGMPFPEGQEKVIIVTHSMGGLVTRYASQVLGAKDKILGIVHGVIPDLGSPAAYRRMKIGAKQEGLAGKVLGATAEELMPVLARAPATLQLLPSAQYKKPWLTIEGEDKDGKDLTLPKSDPFNEIYLSSHRLYRLYEPDIIDKDASLARKNWIEFNKLMKNPVRNFIEKLENLESKYHPNSYVFYGKEIKSDGSLLWKKTQSPMYSKELPNTHRELSLPYSHSQKYELKPSGTPGDGTVPIESLDIIKSTPSIKSLLGTDVDHQNAYAVKSMDYDKFSTAIKFTLRAIVQMVKEVPPCD